MGLAYSITVSRMQHDARISKGIQISHTKNIIFSYTIIQICVLMHQSTHSQHTHTHTHSERDRQTDNTREREETEKETENIRIMEITNK